MNSIIEAAQARRAAQGAATDNPTLHLMQPQDAARWDAFVRACPSATFFHLSGWQRVIEQSFGIKTWFYFVEQDGQILGVLPLAEIKSRLFGHSLGAMPFCVYGGVAAIDDSARVLLDGAADALARQLGVGHLEYRAMERAHPHDPSWLTKELYVTFRKEISAVDDENLNAIPRKQRAMVRTSHSSPNSCCSKAKYFFGNTGVPRRCTLCE